MKLDIAALSRRMEPLVAWWALRNRRERLMVVGVAIAGSLALLDLLAWQPMARERKQLVARIDEAERGVASLAGKSGSDDPATLEQRSAQAQRELSDADKTIASLRGRVVGPDRMAARVRELLASARGLTVTGFRNLPAQATTEARSATQAAPAATAVQASVAGRSLYRHPLEVRVAGSYADIVGWLSRIETEGAGVYLSTVQLEAAASGRIEARVELFTLGTEATWLTL